MDRTTGNKATDAAASKTRSKKRGRTSGGARGRKRTPRTSKKKSEGTPQPCGNEDVAQLGDLAVEALGGRGPKLTRGMINKALQGNVRCTKLIHSLLEESKPAKQSEQDKGEISQASLWEGEPEWNGELSEHLGETCSGRLEPEN